MSPASPAPPTVRLGPGAHKRVKGGHPWVYSNEIAIDAATKALPAGSLVRLEAASGEALGFAHYNPHTLVAARLLCGPAESPPDAEFVAGRIAAALALRERLFPGGFYRLVHAEADGLPGLVIDRFGDAVCIQANTAGMDRWLAQIVGGLDAACAPGRIVLRNDSPARALEGLDQLVRIERGTVEEPVELAENGARFLADLRAGQKTGWFYDQRENRAAVAALAAGRRVLDLYAYGGGFAVACARAGAESVLAVDRSAPALALAERSAEMNGVAAACGFLRAEAFEQLEALAARGERFGIVVADPPAFVKSRKDLNAGVRGYRKLVRLAAAVVEPGGFLFAASCSHNVEVPLFAEQVRRGLHDAGRSGRILRSTGAAADHPVHPSLPESAYLKAQLLQLD